MGIQGLGGYSYLAGASYDASGIIRLRFAAIVAVIEGRNLRTIYDPVLQHRQAFITEQNIAEAALADNVGSVVVTAIRFETEDGF